MSVLNYIILYHVSREREQIQQMGYAVNSRQICFIASAFLIGTSIVVTLAPPPHREYRVGVWQGQGGGTERTRERTLSRLQV